MAVIQVATGDLAVGLAAGAALGGLYLMGLWWTVRRMARTSRPGLLLAASLAVRLGLLLGGLWWLADGHWQLLAAAVAGFALVRAVLVRRLGPAPGAERAP